ncbi:hypothetical protein [Lichenihabitans psoromatis]|uniref:hypothetical protein n=1 Tax=Lichenihabitans psoromatis TaxID=2528642 RepID=UPI001FE22520|nr:hypothetical protein [Lichenihabitans psoromatis]
MAAALFGGALAPTITGFIVQATGRFSPALLTGAVIAVVAAAGYWMLIEGPIPPFDAEVGMPLDASRPVGSLV